MATLKTANAQEKYHDNGAREDVLQYILRPDKAIHGFIGGQSIDMSNPAAAMNQTSRRFGKPDGVQLRHLIISFHPKECAYPDQAALIALEAAEYIGGSYQCVWAVHEDQPHLHIHLVFNSISYKNGRRYRGTKKEFYGFYNHMRSVLPFYGVRKFIYVQNTSEYSAE